MKILHCTFEPPSMRSGGGIVIYQSGRSLCSFADVDYIGPEFGGDVSDLAYSRKYIISGTRNMFIIVKNTLLSVPTSYYDSWKKTIEEINIKEYDAIFMDFSRYDFVVKKAVENKVPIFIRLHNVEQDYYRRLYNEKRSIYTWIKKTRIRKWEEYCIHYADKVISLTEEDRNRLLDLYPKVILSDHLSVIPVCIDRKVEKYKKKEELKLKILITGSLWYGFNAEGTIWFLENVWPLIQDENIELIVAGARPNSQIKSCVENSERVTMVDTPEDMTPYFEMADIYVAPIFDGAGMKVKVAEALSYGLPVLGTEHAFIGYDGIPSFMNCNSPEEFVKGIKLINEFSDSEKEKTRLKCINIFEKNYSMTRSEKDFERIIKKDVYI